MGTSRIIGAITEINITTSSGAIYASGDQIGTVIEATFTSEENLGVCELVDLVLIDKAKQGSIIQLFFFDQNPVNAVLDNDVASISDDEVVDKCIGFVTVASSDYKMLDVNSVACVKNIGLILKNNNAHYKDNQKSIFILVVSGGTPTYTSTSDLVLKLGIHKY